MGEEIFNSRDEFYIKFAKDYCLILYEISLKENHKTDLCKKYCRRRMHGFWAHTKCNNCICVTADKLKIIPFEKPKKYSDEFSANFRARSATSLLEIIEGINEKINYFQLVPLLIFDECIVFITNPCKIFVSIRLTEDYNTQEMDPENNLNYRITVTTNNPDKANPLTKKILRIVGEKNCFFLPGKK